MFVAGPVAQKAGLRNLYFGSAAILLVIGAVGLARLRRPESGSEAGKAAPASGA
jgi:hypothetical protein